MLLFTVMIRCIKYILDYIVHILVSIKKCYLCLSF